MATRKVAKDGCMLYPANSYLAVFIITNTGFSSLSYSPRDHKTGVFDTFFRLHGNKKGCQGRLYSLSS